MNSGLMDRQIVIERGTFGTDDYGGKAAPTWATLTTVWARIQFNGGNESVAGQKKEFRQNATFTIHYYAGVTTKDRISYGGKYWNITSVQEINRNQYTRMEAVAID